MMWHDWAHAMGWKAREHKWQSPPTAHPPPKPPNQPLHALLHVVKNLWIGGSGVFWRLEGSGGWCKVARREG